MKSIIGNELVRNVMRIFKNDTIKFKDFYYSCEIYSDYILINKISYNSENSILTKQWIIWNPEEIYSCDSYLDFLNSLNEDRLHSVIGEGEYIL